MAEVIDKVEKRLYRNNTAGWIGVVTLDHMGQELGVSVPPGGTQWLSRAEAILTARAPQRPEDNPFEEREFRAIDTETGRPFFQKMRPITLVDDSSKAMYGSNRFVPGLNDDEADKPTVEVSDAPSEAVDTALAAASSITAAAAARSAEIEAQAELDGSWTVPEAPGEVLPGRLAGADEPAPQPISAVPGPPAQTPTPAPVITEETAAFGEETGAITNGHADVEGEYAMTEEVGTDQLGDADRGA